MFSFKPVSKDLADELFLKNGFESTKTSMAVVSENSADDEKYGFCLFDYDELTATIIALEYSDKHKFLPECLVKAALNYAANRGAFIAQSGNMKIEKELLELGFKQEGDLLTAQIPKVMEGKCCSCQNN